MILATKCTKNSNADFELFVLFVAKILTARSER